MLKLGSPDIVSCALKIKTQVNQRDLHNLPMPLTYGATFGQHDGMDSPQTIAPIAARSRHLRSKVTNGKSPFPLGGDGRSAWVRLWKDIFGQHAEDLGADLSEAQRASCEIIATLRTELKQLEAKMSEGRASAEDLDLYNRLSGNLRRYLEMLGLERRARPVNAPPTLAEIAADIYAKRQSGGHQ